MATLNNEYRLRIVHDSDAENPFTSWDCEPHLVYEYGRESINGNKDEVITFIESKLTQGMLKRYSKKLASILDVSEDCNFDDRCSEISYELQRANVKQLSQVCEVLKINHKYYTSTGYSQGDYSDVLIICTDKFYETTGANKENENEILESASKLFDAWAWGDTFGFILEKNVNFKKVYEDGTSEDSEEWQQLDSCWGFYGSDFKTNGISEHLPNELHYLLDNDIEVEY